MLESDAAESARADADTDCQPFAVADDDCAAVARGSDEPADSDAGDSLMAELTKENYAEQHQLAVRNAALIYELIKDQPLAALLERIDRAESVGAILDPTLYRDKSKALSEDKRMIVALYHFQSAMAKLMEKAG